jgi:hypothetical protein
MVDGFLGRWSQRKLDARDGKRPAPEPQVAVPAVVVAADVAIQAKPVALAGSGSGSAAVDPGLRRDDSGSGQDVPPPLTLKDAQALTTESDFRPFAARGVAPEVQNAALKTLFSDPHFNVMDRLDTYIDDYSKPDPIPKDMLRKLASAKFLGLFDAEEKLEAEQAAAAAAAAREVADNPTSQTVAQSAAAPAVPSAPPNDDTDLRLQQDHAPPGEDPGDRAA